MDRQCTLYRNGPREPVRSDWPMETKPSLTNSSSIINHQMAKQAWPFLFHHVLVWLLVCPRTLPHFCSGLPFKKQNLSIPWNVFENIFGRWHYRSCMCCIGWIFPEFLTIQKNLFALVLWNMNRVNLLPFRWPETANARGWYSKDIGPANVEHL